MLTSTNHPCAFFEASQRSINDLPVIYRAIGSDSLALPSSIEGLVSLDVKETQPVTPAWDFMWNAVTEDKREKLLFSKSLLVDEVSPSIEGLYEADEMYVAETAVKVCAQSQRKREPC